MTDCRLLSTEEELAAAAHLRIKHFPENPRRGSSLEYFLWKYSDPESALFGSFSNGDVVAIAGVTRKRLPLLESDMRLFEIGDTFTHPSAERQGRFSRLVEQCIEHCEPGPALIYGTPNSKSRKPYVTRLGFADWPRALVHSWWATGRNAATTLPAPAMAARAYAGASRVLASVTLPQRSGVRTRDLQPGDVRPDQRWRYFTNPDAYKVVVSDTDRRAIAVVKRVLEKDLAVSYVVDLVTPHSRQAAARAIKMAVAAERTEASMVAAWLPPRLALLTQSLPLRFVPVISRAVGIDQETHRECIEIMLARYGFMGLSDNV